MVVTGTKEAFMALTSQRGFAGKYGVDKCCFAMEERHACTHY
jgi:hypothetical protein